MNNKRYDIYIIVHLNKENDWYRIRFETNDVDEACDKAHEIEKNSKEEFDATVIYDNETNEWFGYHERGTAYILSK